TDADGSRMTVPNFAFVADNPITLSGALNPASDSGPSNTDAITNVAQPNFAGTTSPYAVVSIFATPSGGGSPARIAQVSAASNGTWSVNSSALAVGTYAITASAVDQFGETTSGAPITIVPALVVDGVGPRINSLQFDRFTGTLTVTYQDNLSGMDLAS